MTKQGGFDEDLMQDLSRGLLLPFNPMQPRAGASQPSSWLPAGLLAGTMHPPLFAAPSHGMFPLEIGVASFQQPWLQRAKHLSPLAAVLLGYNSRPSACSRRKIQILLSYLSKFLAASFPPCTGICCFTESLRYV